MADPPVDPAPRSSGELLVPVGPVGPPGGRRRPPLIAGVAALAGVVIVAIVLAQAFPAPLVAPTTVPAFRTASVTPDAVAESSRPLPIRLDAAVLMERVLDGTIDEWIVYADATLVTDGGLAIAGLGLEVVPDPNWPVETAVPAGALRVLRVRGHRLEYLCSLLPHAISPSIGTLDEELAAASPGAVQPTLRDAGGWLIVHPACFFAASPAPPCATAPFLASDEPLRDGTRRSDVGETVALAPDIWGVDPLRDTVSPGPFLLRPTPGESSEWEVVARYEPTKSVRVVIP